jgi:hypothetical protein
MTDKDTAPGIRLEFLQEKKDTALVESFQRLLNAGSERRHYGARGQFSTWAKAGLAAPDQVGAGLIHAS